MMNNQIQPAVQPQTCRCESSERERRLRGMLTDLSLRKQNARFEGTRGVSRNNAALGFVPAFQDRLSGEAHRSCFANGAPAPLHLLGGLPTEWVATRDGDGQPCALRPGIVAGFLLGDRFYTRAEAARLSTSVS